MQPLHKRSYGLEILLPYLPAHDEVNKVETALNNVDFPPWAINWDYEFGSDNEGEPALWVSIFTDKSLARSMYAQQAMTLFPKIKEKLAAHHVHRWPYVKITTSPGFKVA